MRKTIATVVILVLVWLGYTAWPLYDLLVLVRAMETHDVGTVTRLVYFDAVRCRSRTKSWPPTFGAPESTSARSRKAWPPAPWGLPGITERTIGTLWQIFRN